MNNLLKKAPECMSVLVKVDPSFWHLIPMFLDQLEEDISLMHKALRDNDTDALLRLGHNTKGVGGAYGFDCVTRVGAELEKAARSGDFKSVREVIAQLEERIREVKIIPRNKFVETVGAYAESIGG